MICIVLDLPFLLLSRMWGAFSEFSSCCMHQYSSSSNCRSASDGPAASLVVVGPAVLVEAAAGRGGVPDGFGIVFSLPVFL